MSVSGAETCSETERGGVVPFGARASDHRLWQLSTKGSLAFPVFMFPWFYQNTQETEVQSMMDSRTRSFHTHTLQRTNTQLEPLGHFFRPLWHLLGSTAGFRILSFKIRSSWPEEQNPVILWAEHKFMLSTRKLCIIFWSFVGYY